VDGSGAEDREECVGFATLEPCLGRMIHREVLNRLPEVLTRQRA
jgi:hypothetical protein